MSKKQLKKIASVPYAVDKSYDFYENMLVVEGREIEYKHIIGYGYLLSHSSNSLYYIPVHNSTRFEVRLDLGDEILTFGRSGNGALHIKTQKQKTIDLIFSEVYKCLEVLVAPSVFANCLDVFRRDGLLDVGSLSVTESELVKKTTFGTKRVPLSEYQQTVNSQGTAKVVLASGKVFFSCPLSTINAPLLGPILDTIKGSEE